MLDVGRLPRFGAIVKSARGDDFVAALRVGWTRVYEQGRRVPAHYSAQITGSHIA